MCLKLCWATYHMNILVPHCYLFWDMIAVSFKTELSFLWQHVSYHQISWDIEATRLDVKSQTFHRYFSQILFTDVSAAILSREMVNVRSIEQLYTYIPRRRDFARSYDGVS